MKTKKTITIAVAMSGGVDSSLAAALLKEQGYAVIGIYMKNWSAPIAGVEHCPWVQDQLDARRIAHQLGIPFFTVNFEKIYKKQVIEAFFADYAAGRTPNPDVLCNRFIKFDAFFKFARSLGADFMATGHYARLKKGKIFKGLDLNKDQSYFLWAVQPNVLPYILFPIGSLTKKQVREAALLRGLITAAKKDSQGICFIGQADVRQFLAQHLGRSPGFQTGAVLDRSGQVIGTHQGAGYYTIGQRAGIGAIHWPDMMQRPILYVTTIDIGRNTVTVGEESELYTSRLVAGNASWFVEPPALNETVSAKIRYGQTETSCVMVAKSDDTFALAFARPQRAITPGQSVVLYRGLDLIGGGIIEEKNGSEFFRHTVRA